MKIPVRYDSLDWKQRKLVRKFYVQKQGGFCFYCGCDLDDTPPPHIIEKKINWKLFPDNFMKYPIHLQHNHNTGMTEGAVHNYCNAVMWQYENR